MLEALMPLSEKRQNSDVLPNITVTLQRMDALFKHYDQHG